MQRLLSALFVALPAIAQAQFSIAEVMSAPFASGPSAAPTGSSVAWLLDEQGRHNIWAASAPDWKARELTHFQDDDGQELDELAWAKDGKTLLFVRGGEFENGGENPNPNLNLTTPDQAIWCVTMNGAPPRKLSEGRAPAISPASDTVAFVRNGQIFTMNLAGQNIVPTLKQKGSVSIGSLRWSPDGQHLAFVSQRKDHSLIGVYSPGGNALQYLDASTDFDSEPAWSPDSQRIAYVRVPSQVRLTIHTAERTGPPWSIRVTNLRTATAQEIFHASDGPGSVFQGLASRDQLFWSGNRIVFPWEKTGWCHLYSTSATAVGTASELTPGTGEIEHAAQSQDGRSLFYSSNIGDIDRRHIWQLEPAGSSVTPRQLTRGENLEWEPTPSADGAGLFYLASSYRERSHAVVQTAGNKTIQLASETLPAGFPGRQLVRPEAVTITAADGLELHGQLFLPSRATQGRRTALIFFHGGSRRQMLLGFHYRPYYSNAYALNQYLASQGYVVLSVNYRSGTGYGLEFREALNYGPGGASEYNDVIGAGLFLKARPDVDSRRIGVWGGSYGGYLTALALARGSDLFAAGVDFHGVHDWSAFLDHQIRSGNPDDLQVISQGSRLAFESSPMASVDGWRSPVLLIHGDDDRNVPFAQTVMLADALRQRRVAVKELIFPNEIHDFLLHRHWIEAYEATAEFFKSTLEVNEKP